MTRDTVTTLAEAIDDYVHLGDTIHLRTGYQFPFAATYELTRRHWDVNLEPTDQFTIVTIGAAEWSGPLIHTGAIDHLVTAFAGFGYPSPSPHPVIQERIAEGTVTVEDWTYLTLIERLKAGALNYPFIPTNSLHDSSIGPADKWATIDNPLDDGDTVVIEALRPDVSIAHGIAADQAGNTIVSPIRAEGSWGAFASDTVIVTVEQIVDEQTIRAYNGQTAMPSYLVDAVVEVPFGAHPGALYNPLGIGDIQGYGYDREFYMEFREASRTPTDLESWVGEWVLDMDHRGYLDHVGADRLRGLGSQTWPPGSQRDVVDGTGGGPDTETEPPRETERMIVWAARELATRVESGDHEVVFGGVGVSHLASWVYHALCTRDKRTARPLLVESGAYDYTPPRNDPYIFTPRALPTAKLLDSSTFGLGVVMATAQTVSILTGAQIDRRGRVNSTHIDGTHFVGSGGANDALTNSDEVIVVIEAAPYRLVDEVEYVTGPGTNVTTVVTQYGVLRKHDGELQINEVYVTPSTTGKSRRAAFKDAIGWNPRVDNSVTVREWDSGDDRLVSILRSIDPNGDFRV